MTKEEIIKYAQANEACFYGIRRFQKDEPLAIDDLRWASKHNLDLGYKVYLRAVQHHGLTLKFVPEKHCTYELCLMAVKQEGWAWRHVPEKHKKRIKTELNLSLPTG